MKWELPTHWSHTPSPIQCLTLTRVLESLINVIKHSHASKVRIRLDIPASQVLQLQIVDNGVGFDVHSIQINSMGVGMRSMLAQWAFTGTGWQSSPGGTELRAHLPLHSQVVTPITAPQTPSTPDLSGHCVNWPNAAIDRWNPAEDGVFPLQLTRKVPPTSSKPAPARAFRNFGPKEQLPKTDLWLAAGAPVLWSCFDPFATPAGSPWPQFLLCRQ